MDRITILSYCNDDRVNSISAMNLIKEYCFEFNKTSGQVAYLSTLLLLHHDLLYHCYSIALNFYKRKFIVFDCFSAPDVQGNRHFIKSY